MPDVAAGSSADAGSIPAPSTISQRPEDSRAFSLSGKTPIVTVACACPSRVASRRLPLFPDRIAPRFLLVLCSARGRPRAQGEHWRGFPAGRLRLAISYRRRPRTTPEGRKPTRHCGQGQLRSPRPLRLLGPLDYRYCDGPPEPLRPPTPVTLSEARASRFVPIRPRDALTPSHRLTILPPDQSSGSKRGNQAITDPPGHP